jgi:hypothetical protein
MPPGDYPKAQTSVRRRVKATPRRFAVVDVACGGYDVHASTASYTVVCCSALSVRRSSRQRLPLASPAGAQPLRGGEDSRHHVSARNPSAPNP